MADMLLSSARSSSHWRFGVLYQLCYESDHRALPTKGSGSQRSAGGGDYVAGSVCLGTDIVFLRASVGPPRESLAHPGRCPIAGRGVLALFVGITPESSAVAIAGL